MCDWKHNPKKCTELKQVKRLFLFTSGDNKFKGKIRSILEAALISLSISRDVK